MGNWQPWVYRGHWSMDEHNAVLAELRKAEAELERMGKANNEACDRIRELETLNDALVKDRDFYRDEYQPVSAARDKAEALMAAIESECGKWIAENNRLVTENAEHRRHVSTVMSREAEAKRRFAELEAQIAAVQPAPIATPETLEALARVGFAAWHARGGELREQSLPVNKRWQDITTAILRAARPNLDMTPDVLRDHCITSNAEEFLAFLNSRIRYGVELPPEPSATTAAPTDAQIEALAHALRDAHAKQFGYDPAAYGLGGFRAEARAAYAHIGAEVARLTAERDDLRRQLDERSTRQVKVRFDCTAEEALRVYARSGKSIGGMHATMDYLAARAVIDVPPGVPTVEDVLQIIVAAHYGWGLDSGICVGRTDKEKFTPYADAILTALAPYLRPPLVLPDREALAKALVDAFYAIAPSSHSYNIYTPIHLAQADAAIQMFREVNATAPGECQECAKWKAHSKRLEKDFNAYSSRIDAARAALEGES